MQGALKREHDRIVAGTQDLPYVKRSGDTITGNLAVNGTGGLNLGATQLQNISNGLSVYNASGGTVMSRGPFAGMDFGDRDQTSAAWLWRANAGVAALDCVGVRTCMTMSNAGNMAVSGSVNASLYGIDNLPVIDSAGGAIVVYDGAGQQSFLLYGDTIYYKSNTHVFQNDAGGETFRIDASGNISSNSYTGAYIHSTGNGNVDGALTAGALTAGNLTATGTVTGAYITSTGDVHANNAVSAPSITASGTVQGAYIHSAGTVDGTQLTSSGNINATNEIYCRDLYNRNVNATGTVTASQLTSTGNANIAGTCTAANFVGNFSGGGGTTITGGTVSSTTVNNSGTITTANLSATSNITASGTVTGGSMVCNGTMQVSGTTNLLGSLQVGPSGSYMRADGVGTYNITGSWLTFSDRAAKEAITPYTAGLAEIEQLNPVSYVYTSAIEDTQVTRYGLVADDVAPIVPEMVGSGVTPGGQTMSTLANGHLTWLLVNACKELSARVQALEAQLAAA
jgi:cytoskeletal protein CcmA (bactofilin family)